ncbi:MAG: methyltransferase domain-containing protein [Erysipelotrichaceae bacterium]|nr:methyltransferase domain-containing protein [Erysipelotrichaceae bacterium]
MLVCPKCNCKLVKENRSAKCCHGHCYDYAKEGYLNLLLKNSVNHGDNKDMVVARRLFLEKDYYAPLCDRLIELLQKEKISTLWDMGCGEGYYTHRIALALPDTQVYGNDLSKEAIKLAAKSDKSIQYVIASNAALPIEDGSLDVALCLFSFCDYKEVDRILESHGKLFVIGVGPRHLYELKEHVYEEAYLNPLPEVDSSPLVLRDTIQVTYTFELHENNEIKELFGMTPYAFKTKKSDKEKLDTLDQITLTADFMIQVFTKEA